MNIEIYPAPVEQKSVLRNLMELCSHDYSEYNGEDVDEHGLFGYPYLDHYWTEPDRFPFLVKVDGKWAGFVLVRRLAEMETPTHSIAEFFVLRKYRRKGVGRITALYIFDQFPGQWLVGQEQDNHPAQVFWRRIITEYTGGDFEERFSADEDWHGPHQIFRSRAG